MKIPFSAERLEITAFGTVIPFGGFGVVVGDEIGVRLFAVVVEYVKAFVKIEFFDHDCRHPFRFLVTPSSVALLYHIKL